MCWHFFCFWSFCWSLGPAVVDIQLSTKNNGENLAVFPFFGSLFIFSSLVSLHFASFSFSFRFIFLLFLFHIRNKRGGNFFSLRSVTIFASILPFRFLTENEQSTIHLATTQAVFYACTVCSMHNSYICHLTEKKMSILIWNYI